MRKTTGILAVLFLSVLSARWAKADTCNGVSGNLITNCGFETGDFTGWGGTAPTDGIPDNFVASGTAYEGTYDAFLGSSSPETLTQTFTTTPGTQYTIQFALMNDGPFFAGFPNSFAVDFGGTTLFSESNADQSSFTLESFTTVATSASTALTFTSENNSSYFELDSVSVAPVASPVPEPSSMVLLGTGFAGLVGVARRRFKR